MTVDLDIALRPPADRADASVRHPLGKYRFLLGGSTFCRGVAAEPGYEFVWLHWLRPVPLKRGLGGCSDALDTLGAVISDVVGVDLRLPRPVSTAEIMRFNSDYCDMLARQDLLVGGDSPLARTAVAPRVDAPSEPQIARLTIVRRSGAAGCEHPDFVLSGRGDMDRTGPTPRVVAAGDLSARGVAEKVSFIAADLAARAALLSVQLNSATVVNAYAYAQPAVGARSAVGAVTSDLADAIARCGAEFAADVITCWDAHPPRRELDLELDARRISRLVDTTR